MSSDSIHKIIHEKNRVVLRMSDLTFPMYNGHVMFCCDLLI